MNLAAIITSSPRAPSVRIDVEVCNFVRYVRYVGSKRDLIAEGYATEGMFPADPMGTVGVGTECVPYRDGYFCFSWQMTGRDDGKYDLRTTWTDWAPTHAKP